MSNAVRFIASVAMAAAVAALGVGAVSAQAPSNGSVSAAQTGQCPGGFTWDGGECKPISGGGTSGAV